jgi:hypothetical protein
MAPKKQKEDAEIYTSAPHPLQAATSLPITPLQRAATKALLARAQAEWKEFPEYLDSRTSATVDWGSADNKTKGERGGDKKGETYEGWHLTYEPIRRPSLGLAVWSCVKKGGREWRSNINDHFPSEALGSGKRCKACGHPIAGKEWKEAGGLGNG